MRQNGFVLVVSLIFLVLMTLLGLSMFSGFTTDQTIAGNQREKTRAYDAAQTALNNAQYWLSQPSYAVTGGNVFTVGTTCPASITSIFKICSNALTTPATLPWTSGIDYVPTLPSATPLTISTSGSTSYTSDPMFYVQYLGSLSTQTALYQITATGQGGNANSVAVLQAAVQVSVYTTSLQGP